MSKEKVKIRFNEWHYTCGDGCCDDYGVEMFLNNEKLEHPDSVDGHLISECYIGMDVELALRAVLGKLGYEVEIETTYDDDGE
jgi:hypothetical protein